MKPDPIEVVILNDHASPTGGSAAVAIASALGLAARGIPVTFFTCVGPVAPPLRERVPNLEVICLGQAEIARDPNRLRALVHGWRNAPVVHALRAVLTGKLPGQTVVHVHSWTKALSPFALAAVTDLGFPLVVTLHDFFLACPNGGFFVHGRDEICRRTPLSGSCWRCHCDRRNYGHKLWRNVRTVIQNQMLQVPQKAAHYIGVSDFSLRLMRPFLPPAIPATVIRNPVDCPFSQPVPVERNRSFVFVGRLETEKGAALFARAVQAAGVRATFIGDGALLPELRRLCPRAHFTGWLAPAEIRRHLQGARVLVFPPLWYETLGLVVIEAAAAGVPALVADRCAATDHIRPGINGLHFAQGSVESLTRQISTLASDDDLVRRLGRAAHAWYWAEPWTVDRHVSHLLEIYRETTVVTTPTGEEGALHESAARD